MFLFIIIVSLLVLPGDIELDASPDHIKQCKKLSICQVNIRSLSRSKLWAVQTSLSNILVYDIITISETHLHPGVNNNVFKLEGYHDIIRRDRDGHGGGVAIYIKDIITYKRIFKYETPDLEALWIEINTIEGKILICCCYRPPDNAEFWNSFGSVLYDT